MQINDVQVDKSNVHLLNALAMATFDKAATNGTTMIPEPSSVHTSLKLNVRFWYSIWNGGNDTSGIPGTVSPICV